MKVILRERIKKLGDIGDIVKVKDGYARNYLIPQKLVYKADASAEKAIILEKDKKLKVRKEKIESARDVAEKFTNVEVAIPVKVDENGHLYGSVNEKMIIEALYAKGFDIDKSVITLEHSLKKLGSHKVNLVFMPEVQVSIKVNIVPEEGSEYKPEEAKEKSKSPKNAPVEEVASAQDVANEEEVN